MEERTLVIPDGHFRSLVAEPTGMDDFAGTVLYLHGFPDHPPTARPLLERLARGGYRVFAPWLRGYHPSIVRGPYTQGQLIDDALGLAQLIAPDSPLHVLGHDWGAGIAYGALARAPEVFTSAVTLAVPHPLAVFRAFRRSATQLRMSWYMFFFQLPWLPERVIQSRDMAFIDRLWRDWSPDYTLPEPERRALHQCLGVSMPAPVEYYRAELRPGPLLERERRHASGERISVPTLHLHGARDGCIHPDSTRGQERFFSGPFESEVVPHVGHFLQQEDPDYVATRALDWFARHDAI